MGRLELGTPEFFDVATSIQGMRIQGKNIHICQEFQDAQLVVESTKHEEIEVNAKQAVFFFVGGIWGLGGTFSYSELGCYSKGVSKDLSIPTSLTRYFTCQSI